MRALIPPAFYRDYKVAFLAIPSVDLYDATLLDFNRLPEIKVINPSIREDYIRPYLIAENENSSIIIMDKPNVHSLYTLMLTQSGKVMRKSFGDLTRFEKRKFFEIGSIFFNFWQERSTFFCGYLPRFSFNHDPFTVDRPGLQSIERFHAHLYLVDTMALDKCVKSAKSLSDLAHLNSYKDYFDPTSVVFEKILFDAHKHCLDLPRELFLLDISGIDKVRAGWGPGLQVIYRGHPSFFFSDSFIAYIERIHALLEKLFNSYENNISATNSIDLEGLKKLLEKSDYLSKETKCYAFEVFSCLKSIRPKTYNYLRSRKNLAKNVLSYRHLSYSFSIDFNRDLDAFVLSIVPKLFSEIGGAGFFSYKSVNYVVVQRSLEEKFDVDDIQRRRSFQIDFINYCKELL